MDPSARVGEDIERAARRGLREIHEIQDRAGFRRRPKRDAEWFLEAAPCRAEPSAMLRTTD